MVFGVYKYSEITISFRGLSRWWSGLRRTCYETLKKFESKSAERHHAIFGKMGYGYGIMSNIGKPSAFFHSGYVKGSPSLNIFYPETKTSVIILSNIADEEQGKGFTFKPHVEIKKITDALESTISEMNSSKGNAMKM